MQEAPAFSNGTLVAKACFRTCLASLQLRFVSREVSLEAQAGAQASRWREGSEHSSASSLQPFSSFLRQFALGT